MLEKSLSVDLGELLRISDGLQDLRQVIRCLSSIYARRLESAGRGVMKAKSLKNRYDVILLDVEMNDGEGFEAVKELRSTGYSQTIVAFSALNDPDEHEPCMNAGCDLVLTKPFSRDDIRTLLHSLRRAPLLSSFYNDPSMTPLVNKFVAELPEKVTAIEKALISENIESLIEVTASNDNVVDGLIERGPSVDISACAFDLLGHITNTSASGALEHHVLEQMRQPRNLVGVVGRSDINPDLKRNHRRGMVFLQDDPQAVF